MKKAFGTLPTGETAYTYTISCGKMSAVISDYGATLVRLYVPDAQGNVDDVVLGYDDVNGYANSTTYFGSTVGRNANRVRNAAFCLNGNAYRLPVNDHDNNLHSGPDSYAYRIWKVAEHKESSITFTLESPDGDQGFPGNARIRVTYSLCAPMTLRLEYDAICDQDTVFNLTNHSYFNLAGHEKTQRAMEQTLILPARFFNPSDAQSIPTGELRSVEGTPMDFRLPKAIGRDLEEDFEPFRLQGGYDHNFEVYTSPAAILHDPSSGRTMAVVTDLPGVQFYSGNYLKDHGKDGVYYAKRTGIALETQYYPDSINHPEWPQPFVPANTPYHTETRYEFG